MQATQEPVNCITGIFPHVVAPVMSKIDVQYCSTTSMHYSRQNAQQSLLLYQYPKYAIVIGTTRVT